MKKLSAIIATALCSLAIAATAFAAELISADQARAIAAKYVPAGSSHIVTVNELHKYHPYYEVKFFDNATSTEYEVEVYQNGGAVKEFSMDAKAAIGSTKVALSQEDVKNIVLKEFPGAAITKLKLDTDDGLYEYEVKFYAAGLRGEITLNPETGAVLDKEVKYDFR